MNRLEIIHTGGFFTNMKFRLTITVIFTTAHISADAQKMIKHYTILWGAYTNNIRVSDKWSVNSDAQVRSINWARQWYSYAIRTGLSYSFNKRLSAGAGFALFRYAVYNSNDLLFFKNELRPWQEVAYTVVYNKGTTFSQRIRAEERYSQIVQSNKKTQRYQFILRTRYRLDWLFSLNTKIGIQAGDEIFVNPGYINNTLFFDQNRAFAGVSWQLWPQSLLHIQFVKIFQWRSAVSVLENDNAIRLNYIQKINLHKHRGPNNLNR